MGEKLIYSWDNFRSDVDTLIKKIDRGKYIGVYGIPRGGVSLAVALSERLDLPIFDLDQTLANQDFVLVCDDVVDSGKTRFKFPHHDFICLHSRRLQDDIKSASLSHRLTLSANIIDDQWIIYPWEMQEIAGTDIITRLIEFIGDDPMRPGLVETPGRVIRMYEEFFQGYDPTRRPKMTVVPNGQDGVQYDEMLRDEGYFFSFCEHHIIPFFGQYYFGYIPDKWILGASKISRIIDYYAGKLQIAERLVDEVVRDLEKELNPKGLILIMKARHLCKEMRGVKKWNSPYEAIAVRGYFAENRNNCKMEFLARIDRG